MLKYLQRIVRSIHGMHHKMRWYWLVVLVVVFFDQMTKGWGLAHLPLNEPRPWIDHFVYLTLLYNNRGAWSLFPLPNSLFIIVVSILLVGIFVYALRTNLALFYQIIIGLVIGGGLGNLIDRIRFGYVVDFIDLRWWPVFNVADSAVSIAVTLLVIAGLWKHRAFSK